MRKILLVEDEEILRETYTIILSTGPYDLLVASNGEQALDYCKDKDFDLILLDLMMPVKNGVEFLQEFDTKAHPSTKVIIISNLSTGRMLDDALRLGASKSFVKSNLSPKEMLGMVRYELEAGDASDVFAD